MLARRPALGLLRLAAPRWRRVRWLSSEVTEASQAMRAKVAAALEATSAEVNDVSGGCGSFYKIDVESPKFRGLTIVKQHRLVTDALKDEIAQAHGVTITTKAPTTTSERKE
mmetsp:Transcript_26623/g.86185  ORF Transcript_26623/g.86185 Transcript_26623/m.86185 type:complete len:112 (-) Transcript_26623:70-405(-)